MSLNSQLADLFATLAGIMEIKGENKFKAIAFSKVSRAIKNTTVDLKQAAEQGTLKDIEGIGPSSQKIIEQFVREGRSDDFDEVAASVPAGLIPMLQISGLGPKTISLLWKERGITSVEELIAAIEGKKLEGIKGIAEKKIEAIRQGIQLNAQGNARVGIAAAMPIAKALLEQVRGLPQVKEVQIAGSLRRWRETIGDVDLVCALKSGADGQAVSDAFVKFPQVLRILGQGATKSSVLVAAESNRRGGVAGSQMQVDLRIVPAENYGAALLYLTGSKEHNTHLRGLALEKKLTLNEWGLYRLADYERGKKETGKPPDAEPVASKTEVQVYKALDMEFIEPELREDRGEIDAAMAGKLPTLIELADMQGDLHSHTTASDGRNSIEEMAAAAKERGYKFLAVTDHSRSSVIANGLSVERLKQHVKEIHRISGKLTGITLLAGCEVDILADGHLDFEDEILADLDFVVASPHVALKQDPEKATDRLVRAIENRYVNVIGHPTGRLLFEREGLSPDFHRLFKAAAAAGTALEINSAWPRLDLDDVRAKAAIEAGVRLAIDTDAHSTAGLAAMPYGISVARRAWATKSNVINTLTLAQLRAFVKRKR